MKRLSGLFSAPKTSFQILSDLHLNYESQYLTFHIPVTAPYLILAGNIGRLIDYESYLSFLVRRCNLYEKVFLVLGSLEFHGLGYLDGLELAGRLEKEMGTKGKLEVLCRTRSDVAGTNVTLLGCTLWSKIPEAAEAAVLNRIPEFDQQEGIRDWSIAKHNAEHARDLDWLRHEIHNPRSFAGSEASASSSQLVVVSSFAPELRETLPPWQVASPWSTAYGTELLSGNDWNGVKAWVCGATGRSGEFKKYGVKVASNQRGCVGEEVTGILEDGMTEKKKKGLFDITKVIRV
ncbi:ser/Thr protein phosphatase superfamily [Trematosphaeria pertusa]|uniref:Ser/Thr protein phosphatase superfamily n=1 Tax=Trematosphaeria pertusa TaxID=390896 RepID=A0A6A6HXZ0_9PLEO|nr:ser/Thr protein phosphatase superfamily [Trematosphaeria pertusa]KAF2243085.1 ser/Thr protein phosphatase superfamily [Trematosphaeria pertusa]